MELKKSLHCISDVHYFDNSSFHDLFNVLLCHIYCAPPGHFLFLQVRESNSPREVSVQSAPFPPPVSAAACQVSYLDWYSDLIILLI